MKNRDNNSNNNKEIKWRTEKKIHRTGRRKINGRRNRRRKRK